MAFIPKETQEQLVKLHKVIEKYELENETLGKRLRLEQSKGSQNRNGKLTFLILFIVSIFFVLALFLFPGIFFENKNLQKAYEDVRLDNASLSKQLRSATDSLQNLSYALEEATFRADSLRMAIEDIPPPKTVRVKVGVLPIKSNQLIYSVQLGAFSKFRIPATSENLINFAYQKEREIIKYSIGVFRTYKEAEIFSNHLKKMGVNFPTIKAYYKKKNISIAQARKLQKR